MRRKTKTMDKSICIKLDNELIQKLDYTAQVTGKTQRRGQSLLRQR